MYDVRLYRETLPRNRRQCLLCSKIPRHWKPYCPDHIDQLPYVQRLLAEIERDSAERTLLDKGKRLKKDSPLIADAMILVETHGLISTGLLRKKMQLTSKGIETLVANLKRHRLVKTKLGWRDRTINLFKR